MTDSIPVAKKMKSSCRTVAESDETIAGQKDGTSQDLNTDLLREANQALQESNRLHVRPIVDESRLGIELFVGEKKDEFHGLIKTRFSDFIVHEIDPSGQVAQLTDLEPPEDNDASKPPSLTDFVDSKAMECIAEVNDGYLNQYRIDITGMEKDVRTSLHHAIRLAFDRVESCTTSESELAREEKRDKCEDEKVVEPDSTQQVGAEPEGDNKAAKNGSEADSTQNIEKKYIIVTRRNKISRPKNVWPRDRPEHTHFILYKENRDTMDAIHSLASAINSRPSHFCYAGVKDRRAVTTQWASSWRLEPKRLIAASRRFNKKPVIKVGNFCFKKDPIRLGEMCGNRFDIVVRHLIHNSQGVEVIERAMKSVEERGFVNYFGLQRFGTRSIQTHDIGLAILQSRWEEAIDLILSYRFDYNMQTPTNQDKSAFEESPSENTDNVDQSNNNNQKAKCQKADAACWGRGAEQHNAFIDMWKSKLDADVVFKKYPNFRFTNEGLIMKHLSKSDESSHEYMNALCSLPRNTRSMYVHSYQSLLWNKLVTYRLKQHGFQVAVGDLLLSSDANVSDNSLDVLLSADDPELIADDPNVAKRASEGDQNIDVRKAPVEELNTKIVIATEENKDKYTIFDVVLPIIGSRVRLPENNVKEELERLLGADKLTMESFKARERMFISFGSYRKIMVKPTGVSWQIKQYSHPHQNLVETDLDTLSDRAQSKDKESPEKKSHPEPVSDSSDEALIVSFELPSSSYATMCLREIMKKPSTDFNNRF